MTASAPTTMSQVAVVGHDVGTGCHTSRAVAMREVRSVHRCRVQRQARRAMRTRRRCDEGNEHRTCPYPARVSDTRSDARCVRCDGTTIRWRCSLRVLRESILGGNFFFGMADRSDRTQRKVEGGGWCSGLVARDTGVGGLIRTKWRTRPTVACYAHPRVV